MHANTYLHQQLSATGFAIISVPVMATIRPDLFSTGDSAGAALLSAQKAGGLRKPARAQHLVVKLAGLDAAPMYARFTDGLERRILETTGLTVESIQPAAAPPTQQQIADDAKAKSVSVADRFKAERIAKLGTLARQQPPAHECPLRREILKARADLNQMNLSWEAAPA